MCNLPFFGHLFISFAYTNLYAVQYVTVPIGTLPYDHCTELTIEKGDMEMRVWNVCFHEERPATQDVDDLIFDSNEEWCTSER